MTKELIEIKVFNRIYEQFRILAKKEVFDDFLNILRDNRHSTILKELSEVYEELYKKHLSSSTRAALTNKTIQSPNKNIINIKASKKEIYKHYKI